MLIKPKAIQAYVYCGLLYPHDEKDFDAKVPKDAFNGVLKDVLPELYDVSSPLFLFWCNIGFTD
jgi:hypothetical protein